MKKLLCKLFFHKELKVIKTNKSGSFQKLYCPRCKRYFGINHSVRVFIPWDSELEVLMND